MIVTDAKLRRIRDAIDLYMAHEGKDTRHFAECVKERERLLLEFCESYGERLISDCGARI